MKAFALLVWDMPADSFMKWAILGVFILFALYEIKTEIDTNRIKRFNKNSR